MIRKRTLEAMVLLVIAATLALFAPSRAVAQNDDPPTRVARLAYSQGSVSFQPAGTDDWVDATVNRPVTIGDKLWADSNGRVELQLDGSLIRLSNNTGISFLNLNDNVTQIQLSSGTLMIRVRRMDDNETYEVDTPNLAFSILRAGTYRISVDDSGVNTQIRVRSGEGEVTGGGAAYTVRPNESVTFSGTDGLAVDPQQYSGRDEDQFDTWASNRDAHWSHSNSARYVSQDVVGYEDLDDHGDWRPTQQYGNVWYPRTQQPDWAPYHYGHWAYIEPWGYSWVDDEPWGFAPFHYGRWVSIEGRWGWIPAPPRVEGREYVRPVYAPALVAWVNVGGGDRGDRREGGGGVAVGVGVGAGVAWFALGPREVYVPSYRVSPRYVNNVNVSNTNVTSTVVTNTYNTTIINNTKNVNVTNVTYVNQNVHGAVAATTAQAFTNAQPVSKNVVQVDARAVASAPVRAVTPAVIPNKQAVLGTTQTAAAKPPAAIETRAVVAKQAPPPPPPAFEKQQAAIKSNGGQPLSVAQVRQIQPVAAATAARPAPVKIAPPPAQPAIPAASAPASARPGATPNKAPENANHPANAQPNQPAAAQPQPANRPGEKPANNNAQPNQPAAAQPQPANRPGEKPANNNAQPNQPAAAQPQPANRPGEKPANNSAQPNQPATAQPQPANRPPAQNTPAQNMPAAPTRPNTPPNAETPNHPVDRPADRPAPNNATPPSANHPVDRPVPNNANQPPANNRPENRPPTPNNQPPGNANRNAAPVHPNELPPVSKTAPPASNPQLEQKHQQEQAQLRAQQEQERQKVQQQQEQEHAKLAQQQADAAKRQQAEQQHQQQTQQLQQKHAQEQQQLQQKQQQEKQQQEKPQDKKNPPAKTDRPPQ